MAIIQSRLEGVSGDIVDPDAVQFASRKVAAVSGDARRALDICRRAVEIAEEDNQLQQQQEEFMPATPSKSARKDRTPAYTAPNKRLPRAGRVTIATIKQAINEATTSSMQQYLRTLPLAPKLFLAALLGRIRRTGVRETVLGDVMDEAKRIGKMADGPGILSYLLTECVHGSVASSRGSSLNKTLVHQIPRALGMAGAAGSLMDAGVIGLEARRGDRAARVRLNVGEDEIKLALRDDAEVKGLGFSA